MLSAEFLVLLDKRLRSIYRTNQQFGGRSVLLVGDFLQLDVTSGTSLCKVLYMQTRKHELLEARALFQLFEVHFLTHQHRAESCQIQQQNLDAFRVLPSSIPTGVRWSLEDKRQFRPLSNSLIQAVTHSLSLEDVVADPKWMDETTILVTSNRDKACLTRSTAELFAKRHDEVLYKWKREIDAEIPDAAKQT
ncbi:hypothetical protein PHMEG_00022356 [Phytophthora megakarya]|uniref:ATP-dependent DNA helicase n=1 Tax=Phytophthora megakarya TaxID=4795 RepID=A0A225VL02_9STRA|nr:hypothetical protein PHMEG_00022356 [Phytophthora megakarya]